jgi:6-phosphogluconolactonase
MSLRLEAGSPPNAELIRFDSPVELAQAAAAQWVDVLARLDPERSRHRVALSGGRIAGDFFTAVVAEIAGRRVSLASVDFFWADERCVPPESPDSNYRLAAGKLFRPAGVAEDRIHRIPGERAPEPAAREAEAELRRLAGAAAGEVPVLDMAFLGMGEDGHIASLFPDGPVAADDPAAYRAVVADKPPPHRITLTYRVLAAAREVWVLASGGGKETALRDSLRPNGRTPLAQLLRLRTRTRIFTDILAGP